MTLDSMALVPHAVCWASAPRLIWTMVVTNAVTFLSYVAICATLLYMTGRTRRVIARDWAYFLVGFALFIVACGTTHLLEVVTTWIPIFWIDAGTNVVTAVLSATVAVMLIRRAPRIAFGVNDYAARLANTEKEKRQIEESLLAAQKVEEWSRISATVSHEIRNPLETIQNMLYLISTAEGATPEIVELSRSTASEAERVLDISVSSLSFMRQTKYPEKTDLCAAMESVAFMVQAIVREKGIDFKVDVNGDCVVEAFAGETRQVLLNLVRNACESVDRAGARVRVVMTGRPREVEIVVADEGSGIPPEMMGKMFQFGATSKGESGNGMGLWSVQHIVTRHGGEIAVTSQRGEGTRFTLHWPREVKAMMPVEAA